MIDEEYIWPPRSLMTFPIWLPSRLMTLQDGRQWRHSDDAKWCRQKNVEYGAIASYVALYLCTIRCTWALSRRVLSEDAHSWQWETLKWENRMLGPRHRFSSLIFWCVVVSAVCWCHCWTTVRSLKNSRDRCNQFTLIPRKEDQFYDKPARWYQFYDNPARLTKFMYAWYIKNTIYWCTGSND